MAPNAVPVARRWDGSVPAPKLLAWAALAASLILLAYADRATAQPAEDVLYRYSTAFAVGLQYAVLLAIVLVISRGVPRETLGIRRPAWPQALGLILLGLAGIWIAGFLLNPFLNAGEEQGLAPDEWIPGRAGAFIANFAVIVIVAPIVEEMTYRGLGFAAVRSAFGPLAATVATAVAFGLSHGLLVALPVLTLFGLIQGALRWRTASLYPPLILHAVFNAVVLIVAITL